MKMRRWVVSAAVSFWLLPGIFQSAEKKPITLTFFHMNTVPSSQKIFTETIAAFEKTHPEIRIQETIVAWGDAHSQFMISLVAKQAPDIVMLGGTWATEFIRLNAFVPIEEFIPADMKADFLDNAFDALRDGGHLFGLPWEGATWGIFYRTDLFKESKLDPAKPPANWQELLAAAKALTRDTDGDGRTDQWGLGFPAKGWEPADFWLPFMWQAGCPVVELRDGKWQGVMSNEAGQTATTFYVDLVRTHRVTPESITAMDWEAVKNGFVAGRFATMFNGMWVVKVLRESAPQLDGKWATAPYPAGPTGIRAALGYPNTLHITQQSQHKKEAWQFMEHLYSTHPSVMDRYAMDVSSLNWTKSFIALPYSNDPLLKPFVQSMAFSHYPPAAPKYEVFRERILNPGLQALILGQKSVKESLELFDREFNALHP
jgi:multiple sugar transport system substrate-binding protein